VEDGDSHKEPEHPDRVEHVNRFPDTRAQRIGAPNPTPEKKRIDSDTNHHSFNPSHHMPTEIVPNHSRTTQVSFLHSCAKLRCLPFHSQQAIRDSRQAQPEPNQEKHRPEPDRGEHDKALPGCHGVAHRKIAPGRRAAKPSNHSTRRHLCENANTPLDVRPGLAVGTRSPISAATAQI
jgi:hypothetical protein